MDEPRGRTMSRIAWTSLLVTLTGCATSSPPATPSPAAPAATRSQATPTPARASIPSGRAAIASLDPEPLEFEQPTVTRHEIDGVNVLFLEDRTLPLVTFYAYFRGGYGLFEREHFAAAMGLPALLRYGGTASRTPEQVDEVLDFHALQLAFGTQGGSVTSSINTLTEHVDTALDLWSDMLARPAFAESEIEAWRGRQLESVRRRVDDPGVLAFSELNRLLYGDHPIGWEMDEGDLTPERLTPDTFRWVHDRVVCRDNLVLGLTGDVAWSEAEPLVRSLLERVEACPGDLPEAPLPEIRRGGGIFLVERDLDQAVIAMAHPTSVRLADDPEYYAAMIGNSVLGASGFSSRLVGRVRTEEGYAYSASSLWTTPRRHDGLIGATTRTRPSNVVPAVETILRTMAELRVEAPTEEEVGTTVDQIVNGFVFNFDSPSQIVSRTMYYVAQDLPTDWLERYWQGVQEVTPERVREVFAEHLRPEEMTILVVGDPERIGRDALAGLGPVTLLEAR
jgi:zinc protease